MTTNGMPAAETQTEAKKFLLDPYREWAQGEGIPIHLDFGHDLIAKDPELDPIRQAPEYQRIAKASQGLLDAVSARKP